MKETWECNVCGLPCKIEIQFSNEKLPVHILGEDHFRDKQFCPCREARPDWEKRGKT